MQIAIYIISALLTNFVFSFATSLLIVFAIEKSGDDPGSPGIILFVLIFICGILSIVTASIMSIAKAKYQKEFSAKFSALIFLFTYFPIHIIGFYFSDKQLSSLEGSLAGSLVNLSGYIMFFSYIPFFHMTTQGLINLNEFTKRQEVAGNRYPKLIFRTLLGVVVLFTCYYVQSIFF